MRSSRSHVLRRASQFTIVSLRGLAAVLVMLSYLVVNVAHAACDAGCNADIVKTHAIVAALDSPANDTDPSGKTAPGHHCHACVSVSLPVPDGVVVAAISAKLVQPLPRVRDSGLAPGLDPPPPKVLT